MFAAIVDLISCFIRVLHGADQNPLNSSVSKLWLILGLESACGELGSQDQSAQGRLTLVVAGGEEEELSALTRLSRVCTLQVGLL